MSERYTGIVKWYAVDKGFGFLLPDAGGTDVFVHKSALAHASLNGLVEGQKVTYALETKNGKTGAVDVELQ